MADMPWREAVIEVLRRESAAMHYTAIAERVVSDGLRKNVGATPAMTVSATITTSLNNEGVNSPFQRVARGEYILRAPVATVPPSTPGPTATQSDLVEDEEIEGPIHALGMFWDRAQVRWTPNPAILGRQQIGADSVDMAGQKGIYLLHDMREVVYVGRCTDRPLGKRLYEHTVSVRRSTSLTFAR